MGPKDRHLLHRFLAKAPLYISASIAPLISIALVAAGIWPEAKDWTSECFSGLVGALNWWVLATFIVLVLVWLWGFLATRDRDDMSLEGSAIGERAVGDDNRRGIFDSGIVHGDLIFSEGSQQRRAPPQLAAILSGAANDEITIQVRIYGQDYEMQTLGRDIYDKLLDAGLKVILFDGDHGTRYLRGVIVEPAPNAISRQFGREIVSALSISGISVKIEDGPGVWSDQSFVRIAIGGNA